MVGITKMFEYSIKIICWLQNKVLSTKDEEEIHNICRNDPHSLFDIRELDAISIEPGIKMEHILMVCLCFFFSKKK